MRAEKKKQNNNKGEDTRLHVNNEINKIVFKYKNVS